MLKLLRSPDPKREKSFTPFKGRYDVLELPLLFCFAFIVNILLPHRTLADSNYSTLSFQSGFENGVKDWSATGNGTWSASAAKHRSGIQSALFHSDASGRSSKLYNRNYVINTPKWGTNYITVILYATAGEEKGIAMPGLHDSIKNVDIFARRYTSVSSGEWTKIAYTFAVEKGKKYYPFIDCRSTKGGAAVNLYFDDLVAYISENSKPDAAAPKAASNIFFPPSTGKLKFSWIAGTDGQSGISGALVLRTGGFTQNQPVLAKQTLYSTIPTEGPVNITGQNTWTVVANTGFQNSVSDSMMPGGYTYLVYMRDRAFNYSDKPIRAYVLNGSGEEVSLSAIEQKVDAIYIDSGARLNSIAGYTFYIVNGLVNGTLVNHENIVIGTGGLLKITSTGKYIHAAGQNGGRSIPAAVWLPGSTCIVTGYPGTTLNNAVGGLKQNFYNFTWNCPGQLQPNVLDGITILGKLEIKNTGASTLNIKNKVSVKGNYVQQGGTVLFEGKSSWLQFNGKSRQSFSCATGILSGIVNIALDNRDSLILNNGLSISGSLVLKSGQLDNTNAPLTLADKASCIMYSGAITQPPVFKGVYNLYYNTTYTTGNELTSDIHKLNKLIVNTTGTIYLTKDITVNDTFGLHSGTLTLGNYNLTIASKGVPAYYNARNFVVTNGSGFLKICGLGRGGKTKACTFPIGSVAGSYTPAILCNKGEADTFMARVINKVFNSYDPTGVPSSGATELVKNAVKKTWLVREGTPGGSKATLAFQWNEGDQSKGFNSDSSYMGHFSNSMWLVSTGSVAVKHNPYSRQIKNIESFSLFGVGTENFAGPAEHEYSASKEDNAANAEVSPKRK